MKIIVCAATPVEAFACETGIAKSGDTRFEVLQTGMGVENARSALRHRFRSGKPDLVVSAGFAGIWKGLVAVGEWVSATEVWSKSGTGISRVPCTIGKSPSEKSAPIVSVDVIGKAPADLSVAGDFIIVDMESAGLAEVCATDDVPFSVYRMITDTPEEPLPEFVSTFTSVFQSPSWEDKFKLGTRGLLEVAQNVGGVASFLKSGRQWALDLQTGWQENARRF